MEEDTMQKREKVFKERERDAVESILKLKLETIEEPQTGGNLVEIVLP